MTIHSADNAHRIQAEHDALRQELAQYRSQIFQLQLIAPAVAVLILQQPSADTMLRLLIPVAASWLLLLSLHAMNRLYRQMIIQVGYLLYVVESPWEHRLKRFRKDNRPLVGNPGAGRLGTASFLTHSIIIGVAQFIAIVGAREQSRGWQCFIGVQLLATIFMWLLITRRFTRLTAYRKKVDDAWQKQPMPHGE